MARHEQCQKLGESHNADLTTPQGVTYQTFIDKHVQHNTIPPKGGRAGNKIIVTVCFKMTRCGIAEL